MWLSNRCFTLRGEERIPLRVDSGLTAQLGSVEYSRPRRFRAMLEQWLGQIRTVWPECPAQTCSWDVHSGIGHTRTFKQAPPPIEAEVCLLRDESEDLGLEDSLVERARSLQVGAERVTWLIVAGPGQSPARQRLMWRRRGPRECDVSFVTSLYGVTGSVLAGGT